MRNKSGAEDRDVNSAQNEAFNCRPLLFASKMSWVKSQEIILKKKVKATSRSSLKHKELKTVSDMKSY